MQVVRLSQYLQSALTRSVQIWSELLAVLHHFEILMAPKVCEDIKIVERMSRGRSDDIGRYWEGGVAEE